MLKIENLTVEIDKKIILDKFNLDPSLTVL